MTPGQSGRISLCRGAARLGISASQYRELRVRTNLKSGSIRHLVWVALLVVLAGGSSQPAAAQEPAPTLEHLEIALWPEYDRAAMLVIYRFQIAAEVAFPATIALPIPVEVGQPHAVAWQGPNGELFDAPFEVDSAGTVTMTIPEGGSGQLEYYAELDLQGQQRRFHFEWPGTVDLGGFSYEVQQPIGAQALSVVPAPDALGPGPLGLTYAAAELGPQPAGSQLVIEVSYQKSGSSLTLPSLQLQSEPLAPSATAGPASTDLLPLILAGGGTLLVLVGAIYYFRGRPTPKASRRRRVPRVASAELELLAVYCHQCGTKANVSDRFCRNCGTRLRVG